MSKLIGRESEITWIESVLQAGRHVLLEGPVGSGKTSLAVFVAKQNGRKVVRVDGDGRFTEQKLVGSFDPKLVLEWGFTEAAFLPGPLYLAMKSGSVLLVNELNRMPEMVQNVLLPALDEGFIQVPHIGQIQAAPGFCLIATQNPREFVGTSPLGEALLDRLEWISIPYLDEAQEVEIAKLSVTASSPAVLSAVFLAVRLVRLTRNHPHIKRGASIRAAQSLLEIFIKSLESTNPEVHSNDSPEFDDLFWRAARMALANRIELQTSKFSAQSFERSLDEILADLRNRLQDELKKKT
jgi:MoxR-like ATPase